MIFFRLFFYLPKYTINYLVATAEDGAAAPDFLGLGCVPSRKPFLEKRQKYLISLSSLVKTVCTVFSLFGPVVSEEKIFENVDG